MSTTAQAAFDERSLSTLAAEVAELRDLFQRRLFEDRSKNRLYEELYGQLAIARDGLSAQVIAPLLLEVLLVVDRISAVQDGDDVVLESVRMELVEILERRGVRPVPATDSFDPAIHDVIRTVQDSQATPGTVTRVIRPGYLLGQSLLRPERVVVVAEPPRREQDAENPQDSPP
jgi:molecular chaperone GrpE